MAIVDECLGASFEVQSFPLLKLELEQSIAAAPGLSWQIFRRCACTFMQNASSTRMGLGS
jgi:hypothetical protein